MTEKNHEAAFIPCGDSMEKMDEINDRELESVSGGVGASSKLCPVCGGRLGIFFNAETKAFDLTACIECGRKQ